MKLAIIIVLIALLGIGIGGYFYWRNQVVPPPLVQEIKYQTMQIISPEFANSQSIPAKYTCDGDNISPPLRITDTPEQAQSLVLIVDDPDAPIGSWLHWTVWNIEPKTNVIAEGEVPAGSVEGMTSFGTIGYGGPCPPRGEHRYVFKIFALDERLDLPAGATRAELESAMDGHVIAQGELVGLYSK